MIYTIGHSTRTFEEILKIITAYGVAAVIDVRTTPKSRYNPQFNSDALQQSLPAEGIEYLHMKGLGGLRHTIKDSVNTGWRNLSFRGYADYMQTEEFAKSLAELIEISTYKQIVIMCAEAVPWRCHRSLIGDALLIRDIEVNDILSEKSCKPHALTPFAKVENGKITYPEPS